MWKDRERMLDCIVNYYDKVMAIWPSNNEEVWWRLQPQTYKRGVPSSYVFYVVGTCLKLVSFRHFLLSCVAKIGVCVEQEL
jgi:hypothetical protein